MESYLQYISLYNTIIDQRKRELAALEAIKGHIREETYKRIRKAIKAVICRHEKELAAIMAMIEGHPNQLERQVIFYKWVEGYKIADLEYKLNYSLDYLQQVHARAKKNFDNEHPVKEGA